MRDLYTLNPTQIIMYATDTCADCFRVKKYFEAKGISYRRVGLEGDVKAAEFVMRINRGLRSVPTIVFPDGSILVEPGWDELNEKFPASGGAGG